MKAKILFLVTIISVVAENIAVPINLAAGSVEPPLVAEQTTVAQHAAAAVVTFSRWKRGIDVNDDLSSNSALLFFTVEVFVVLFLVVIAFCTGFYIGSSTSRQDSERQAMRSRARALLDSSPSTTTTTTTTTTTAIDMHQHLLTARMTTRGEQQLDSNDKRRRWLDKLSIYDVRDK